MKHRVTALFFCLVVMVALPLIVGLAQITPEIQARQAELEAQLAAVEKEIATKAKLLQRKQQESASIERDLAILTYQISQAKLRIQAKEIQIKQLGEDIGKKASKISDLSAQISRGQESLGELMRQTREREDISLIEVALSDSPLSKLFADVNSFVDIETALAQTFNIVRSVKTTTEQEKNALEDRRVAELDAQAAIQTEKKLIERKEAEKNSLLKFSRLQESGYRSLLANREAERARIMSALFQLRGAAAISFGQAYDYAKEMAAKTGVRPAFLMAILTQESNLGQNVGTCNRPTDPPSKNWQNIMKPSRDFAPFLALMKDLGLDPNVVPLSCPAAGGFGGAMGPAQFIPSTWALYATRIGAVLGISPANPWIPEHAFVASALLLKDLGAAAGGYTAERRAALKYYAGGNWQKTKNAFYGDEVMAIAAGYQEKINVLQNN